MPVEDDRENIQAKPFAEMGGTPPQPANPNAKSNESGTEKLERDIKRGEWWLIRIGIATVLINTVIALIYWGQLKEMRKATSLTRDAVQVASNTLLETQRANKVQEGLNQQTLQTTTDNFQRDQRPWIVTKDMFFAVTKQDVGSTLSGQILLVNNGRSPAFNVRVTKAGIQMNKGELNVDKWMRANKRSTMLAIVTDAAIMGSGDIVVVPFQDDYAINDQVAHDIKTRKLWVYTFGDVHYTDSFGFTHLTRFCGIWDPKAAKYSYCPTHVYVDRDK